MWTFKLELALPSLLNMAQQWKEIELKDDLGKLLEQIKKIFYMATISY